MVYVICCNDALYCATTDKYKAERELESRKTKTLNDVGEEAINLFYWHIHEVEEVK